MEITGQQKARILVIEDEYPIRRFIVINLERAGFEVYTASTGEEGLVIMHRNKPSLVVLDLRLPGLDGFTVCRRLRDEYPETAVIILTARSQNADKVKGLELGADDYVTKPFDPLELIARIRAVLRRLQAARTAHGRIQLDGGRVTVDLDSREAWCQGSRITLTPREFDLLACLAVSPGYAFSRQQLLDQVWGEDYLGDPKTVDVHIRRLREKLEVDPNRPRLINTVWGVGYRLQN